MVVPSLRGAERLPALLDAFRRQYVAYQWELRIVLDGDVDGSAEVLDRLGGDLPLVVVQLPETAGRPAALNAGFSGARGRIVIRCDDDLHPSPDYIKRHLRWHESGRRIGVVGLQRNVFADSRYAEVYGVAADRSFAEEAYQISPDYRWLYWAGNCSVSRADWELVGPYNDDFADRGEDWEWGYRLSRTGVEIVLDPELEIAHDYWGSSAARRMEHAFATGRAEARFERLHGVPARPGSTGGRSTARAAVWSGLVAVAAWLATPPLFRRYGATIDRLLPLLPVRLARQLVALGIEMSRAAGYAGRGGT